MIQTIPQKYIIVHPTNNIVENTVSVCVPTRINVKSYQSLNLHKYTNY